MISLRQLVIIVITNSSFWGMAMADENAPPVSGVKPAGLCVIKEPGAPKGQEKIGVVKSALDSKAFDTMVGAAEIVGADVAFADYQDLARAGYRPFDPPPHPGDGPNSLKVRGAWKTLKEEWDHSVKGPRGDPYCSPYDKVVKSEVPLSAVQAGSLEAYQKNHSGSSLPSPS